MLTACTDMRSGRPGVFWFALLLLVMPAVAHAHMYWFPAALVTVPVTGLALLLIWPVKALVIARRLPMPVLRAVGLQFLSALAAGVLFVLVQAAAFYIRLPFFWFQNYVDRVQWSAVAVNAACVFLLYLAAWRLDGLFIARTMGAEQAAEARPLLREVNLVAYGIVALVNGVILYLVARSMIGGG